ncbi:SH3 domain-containing protein [Crocosphaera sp.]|uniref:SH3 domain-containing protein n=1 Tax=Crocosphaera sp. TaxID=2729996 RepID=UPI0026313294|nr:SH3 domain-containing protein [Crocosphaera sp.]MDJ0578966.1 SH3 domain-containing protein [Crocosphaera sp.]
MNRLSGVFQFLLGFFLGIFLLVGGTASLAYVVFARMSANPEKPTFAEEKPPETTAKADSQPVSNQESKTEAVEEVAATETVFEEEEETEELPDGAYRAKVTWSTGLSLRSQPASDADRIGGVGYDAELIILKTTADGDWQQVRLPGSQREGWVKAGNVEKIEE